MKTIIFRTMLIINLGTGGLFFGGCGEETADAERTFPVTGLIIHNRSQFEIEHLYVYEATRTYLESDNLIEGTLGVEEMVFHRLPEGEYLVTVSRRQNATGDLFAYTTTEPILLNRPKVVEYYDTEFRVYDLKLTVPTEEGVDDVNETEPQLQRTALPYTGSIPTHKTWME